MMYHDDNQALKTSPPDRSRQVPEQAMALKNKIECLIKEIRELESRLTPVLHPVPPSPEKAGGTVRVAMVPFAEVLSELCFSIDAASHSVTSVLERLEI